MELTETIRETVRLTRRGKAALAVALLAIVFGWQFGARSLNAIAAPILAALAISAVMLARAPEPSVGLSRPEPGLPGETRSIAVDISGTGIGAVELTVPEGLAGETGERLVTLPGTPEFDIELETRGIYTVGPPRLAYRDPLGLLERAFPTKESTDVVVYPKQYAVETDTILSRLFLDELEAERQEFDRLREYQAGDPLRNIHWKSSAKHDEFLVMEFSPSQRDETVSVTATAPEGKVDEMARIAATITNLALDAGYSVELTTPAGHIPPGQGESHRTTLFRLLARTTPGTPQATTSEDIDIDITIGQRELIVRIGDETYPASTLFAEKTAGGTTADGTTADETSANGTDTRGIDETSASSEGKVQDTTSNDDNQPQDTTANSDNRHKDTPANDDDEPQDTTDMEVQR
jgi:uncharacterized protein (DUF58 family)